MLCTYDLTVKHFHLGLHFLSLTIHHPHPCSSPPPRPRSTQPPPPSPDPQYPTPRITATYQAPSIPASAPYPKKVQEWVTSQCIARPYSVTWRCKYPSHIGPHPKYPPPEGGSPKSHRTIILAVSLISTAPPCGGNFPVVIQCTGSQPRSARPISLWDSLLSGRNNLTSGHNPPPPALLC